MAERSLNTLQIFLNKLKIKKYFISPEDEFKEKTTSNTNTN